MKGSSGAFEVPFSFRTRFEEEPGTNPEELIGSALAGCFSMYLAAQLTNAGFPPDEIRTTAKVHLEAGPQITLIELETEARVVNIDEATFQEKVNVSRDCWISSTDWAGSARLTSRFIVTYVINGLICPSNMLR